MRNTGLLRDQIDFILASLLPNESKRINNAVAKSKNSKNQNDKPAKKASRRRTMIKPMEKAKVISSAKAIAEEGDETVEEYNEILKKNRLLDTKNADIMEKARVVDSASEILKQLKKDVMRKENALKPDISRTYAQNEKKIDIPVERKKEKRQEEIATDNIEATGNKSKNKKEKTTKRKRKIFIKELMEPVQTRTSSEEMIKNFRQELGKEGLRPVPTPEYVWVPADMYEEYEEGKIPGSELVSFDWEPDRKTGKFVRILKEEFDYISKQRRPRKSVKRIVKHPRERTLRMNR